MTLHVAESKIKSSELDALPSEGFKQIAYNASGDFVLSVPKRNQSRVYSFKERVALLVDSMVVLITVFSLVLLDLSLTLCSFFGVIEAGQRPWSVVYFVIIAIFVIEIGVRCWSTGVKNYVKSPLELTDGVLVFISLVFSLTPWPRARVVPVLLRILRLGRVYFRLRLKSGHLKAGLRRVVGQNRQRVQHEGFDLDLTYITARVIAMGYPALRSTEKWYRNSMDDVVAFLDAKHRRNYKVYNLCMEPSYNYDPSFFHGRACNSFQMQDHSVMKLSQIIACCNDIKSWLDLDSENVVAIHCKAGKGRTGTIVTSYLLLEDSCLTADAALAFYAAQRTDLTQPVSRIQGVETPSQVRYCNYVHWLAISGIEAIRSPSHVTIRQIVLEHLVDDVSMPNFCGKSIDPRDLEWSAVIENFVDSDQVPIWRIWKTVQWTPTPLSLTFLESGGFQVYGDVRITITFSSRAMCGLADRSDTLNADKFQVDFKQGKSSTASILCSLWLHTSFLSNSCVDRFAKHALDIACKDASHKKLPLNFALKLEIDRTD